jgi:hypothetical protein
MVRQKREQRARLPASQMIFRVRLRLVRTGIAAAATVAAAAAAHQEKLPQEANVPVSRLLPLLRWRLRLRRLSC